MTARAFTAAVVAVLACALCASPASAAGERTKVYIVTDIGGGDTDDEQSLVRLLHYANDLDIVGISAGMASGSNPRPNPDVARRIIDAYGEVEENLRRHDPRFPSAAEILAVLKTDNVSDADTIGSGRDSQASNHIIDVVDSSSAPVWFLVWGGPRALMQALWTVAGTRSAEELEAFKNKIRVYDIAAQDESFGYAREQHPDIFYLYSERTGAFRGMFSDHGPTEMLTRAWVSENVTEGHGPLGALYPNGAVGGPFTWGSDQGVKEGDTPSLFHVLPLGLSDPLHPEWGSWGGRFRHDRGSRYCDAQDTWNGHANAQVTVARWRDAYQRDFQARLDWSVRAPDDANHPPEPSVGGDRTLATLFATAGAGEAVSLDAGASRDPDGDALAYEWFHYKEPSGYAGEVAIDGARSARATVRVPADAAGKSIHIVLAVTDAGSPRLTRYRRVVINPSSSERANLAYGAAEADGGPSDGAQPAGTSGDLLTPSLLTPGAPASAESGASSDLTMTATTTADDTLLGPCAQYATVIDLDRDGYEWWRLLTVLALLVLAASLIARAR